MHAQRGGTVDDARAAYRPVLEKHGFAMGVTLKRIHQPPRDPAEHMTVRMLMAHAHFRALRENPRSPAALSHVLTATNCRSLTVHTVLTVLTLLPRALVAASVSS